MHVEVVSIPVILLSRVDIIDGNGWWVVERGIWFVGRIGEHGQEVESLGSHPRVVAEADVNHPSVPSRHVRVCADLKWPSVGFRLIFLHGERPVYMEMR
jgi:hypothetical protein